MMETQSTHASSQLRYAGFWLRFLAWLIDGTLVFLPLFLIGYFLFSMAIGIAYVSMTRPELLQGGAESAEYVKPAIWMGWHVSGWVTFLVAWLYRAGMESRRPQGTIGKLICRIKVTDERGQRVSFARASGRHFARLITNMTCGIGYIIAGFTAKKQTIHDLVSSCVVVKRW